MPKSYPAKPQESSKRRRVGQSVESRRDGRIEIDQGRDGHDHAKDEMIAPSTIIEKVGASTSTTTPRRKTRTTTNEETSPNSSSKSPSKGTRKTNASTIVTPKTTKSKLQSDGLHTDSRAANLSGGTKLGSKGTQSVRRPSTAHRISVEAADSSITSSPVDRIHGWSVSRTITRAVGGLLGLKNGHTARTESKTEAETEVGNEIETRHGDSRPENGNISRTVKSKPAEQGDIAPCRDSNDNDTGPGATLQTLKELAQSQINAGPCGKRKPESPSALITTPARKRRRIDKSAPSDSPSNLDHDRAGDESINNVKTTSSPISIHEEYVEVNVDINEERVPEKIQREATEEAGGGDDLDEIPRGTSQRTPRRRKLSEKAQRHGDSQPSTIKRARLKHGSVDAQATGTSGSAAETMDGTKLSSSQAHAQAHGVRRHKSKEPILSTSSDGRQSLQPQTTSPDVANSELPIMDIDEDPDLGPITIDTPTKKVRTIKFADSPRARDSSGSSPHGKPRSSLQFADKVVIDDARLSSTSQYTDIDVPGLDEFPTDSGSTSDLQQTDITILTAQAQKIRALVKAHPRDFDILQQNILAGLTGQRRLPLTHLSKAYEAVHGLLSQTIKAGEGNSMLIIGPRGTGKSAIVETALADLAKDYGNDYHVVRLHGFIHTDDKSALKEIWRQLGRELEATEEDYIAGTRINFADTLTSLLGLLSYEREASSSDVAFQASHESSHNKTPGSETSASRRGRVVSKAVIIVLDEVDLFALHSRQTLLYNLFDLAQSSPTPLLVLGLTTKVNVIDLLEKRVKSRFGQRYAHVHFTRTFEAFRSLSMESLLFRPATGMSMARLTPSLQRLSEAWNAYISHLLTASPSMSRIMFDIYSRSKSVSAFHAASLLPIQQLTSSSPVLTPQHYLDPLLTLSNQDSANLALSSDLNLSTYKDPALQPPNLMITDALTSLSSLALTLLIAAARLEVILAPVPPLMLNGRNTQTNHDTTNHDTRVHQAHYGTKPPAAVTFSMVYEEYLSLVSRARLSASASGQIAHSGLGAGAAGRVWSKAVAKREWQVLDRVGLILPASNVYGGPKSYSAGSYGYISSSTSSSSASTSTHPSSFHRGRGSFLSEDNDVGTWRIDVSLEEIGAWLVLEKAGISSTTSMGHTHGRGQGQGQGQGQNSITGVPGTGSSGLAGLLRLCKEL